MANVSKPTGFTVHNAKAGVPFVNSIAIAKPIAYNYGTAIYSGDPVKLVSGKVNLAANTDQINGIFVGLVHPLPTATFQLPAYWPANGFATLGNQDCYALVIEDPNVVFEAQFGSATVPTIANINSYYKTGAGTANTTTGQSGVYVDASTVNTAVSGLVWKFLGFLDRPDNDRTTAYARGLFLPVRHDLAATVAAA